MIPNRYGRIVTVASIAGLRGNPVGMLKTLAYNTTKGGLVNFTRALAAEWGEYNITVNAIAPGFFPSKMSRTALEQIGEQIIAHTPLQRLGDDEDLKGIVALLASDASRHITGQIIAVDGGVRACLMTRARPAMQNSGINIPFTEHLGVQLVEMTKEHAIVTLHKRPELLNSWGATHGGVIMTMLDLVMSWAVRGHYDVVGGVLTVDMSVGFMKGSFGDKRDRRRPGAARRQVHRLLREPRRATTRAHLLAKAIGTFKLLAEREKKNA